MPAIRLHFTPTVEDYAEAFTPETQSTKAKAKRAMRVSLFGWVLFGGLAIVLIFLIRQQQRPPLATPPWTPSNLPIAPPEQDLLATLIPSALPAAFFAIVIGVALFKQRSSRQPDDPTRAVERTGQVTGAVTAVLMCVALLGTILPNNLIPWHPSRRLQTAVGLAPWLLLLLGLAPFLSSRRAARRVWNQRPTLRFERTVDVEPDYLTLIAPTYSTRFLWSHFATFRETENVFILTTVDSELHVLAKRGLENPADLDPLRGLLLTAIPSGKTLPDTGAFPVLTPAPPA